VTVTLTRQNLEAAVYCSKNDRLQVLQKILICLCERSIEQVPAGVFEPCGILTNNNIIKNNNNNNNNNNRASPSKSLKIISYSGDRLTRSHIVIPPQQITPSTYGAYSAYKFSSLKHSQICVGICITHNFEYKSADYMAIDFEYTPCSKKLCIHVLGAAFSGPHSVAQNAAPNLPPIVLLYSSRAFTVFER